MAEKKKQEMKSDKKASKSAFGTARSGIAKFTSIFVLESESEEDEYGIESDFEADFTEKEERTATPKAPKVPKLFGRKAAREEAAAEVEKTESQEAADDLEARRAARKAAKAAARAAAERQASADEKPEARRAARKAAKAAAENLVPAEEEQETRAARKKVKTSPGKERAGRDVVDDLEARRAARKAAKAAQAESENRDGAKDLEARRAARRAARAAARAEAERMEAEDNLIATSDDGDATEDAVLAEAAAWMAEDEQEARRPARRVVRSADAKEEARRAARRAAREAARAKAEEELALLEGTVAGLSGIPESDAPVKSDEDIHTDVKTESKKHSNPESDSEKATDETKGAEVDENSENAEQVEATTDESKSTKAEVDGDEAETAKAAEESAAEGEEADSDENAGDADGDSSEEEAAAQSSEQADGEETASDADPAAKKPARKSARPNLNKADTTTDKKSEKKNKKSDKKSIVSLLSKPKAQKTAEDKEKKKKVSGKGSGKVQNMILGILAAILVVEAIATVALFSTGRISLGGKELSSMITEEDVQEGLSYLQSIEDMDADAVLNNVAEANKERRRALLATNENAVWSAFDDIVIVGDSRVVGFWFFEFLPENRAISEGGAMVRDIPIYLDRITAMKPSNVILAFGLNDYGIGEWPDVNDYTDVFVENVKLIQAALPGVEIYVNSTLPAVGVGLSASSAYPRIPEYNEALKEMCIREGYHYIDNDTIARENEDLYDDDGLHLQREMYLIWATNMLGEVMN